MVDTHDASRSKTHDGEDCGQCKNPLHGRLDLPCAGATPLRHLDADEAPTLDRTMLYLDKISRLLHPCAR